MTATTKLVNGRRVPLTPAEAAEREAEWAANDVEAKRAAVVAAPVQHREDRKQAYIAELGPDPDIVNTMGDVLDALIKKVRAMDAVVPVAQPEFDAMVAEIDRIKAERPKPSS